MNKIFKVDIGNDQIISFDNLKDAKKYFRTQVKRFKKIYKAHQIKKEIIILVDNYIVDYWRLN